MTISAQVIDTIVEWIDDNLHQPLRIEEIARHAGYSKWHLQLAFAKVSGVTFANASCCWQRVTCVNRTSVSTISVCATALIRSRRLRVSLPVPSTSRLARTAKRTTAGHTECVVMQKSDRVRRSRTRFFFTYDASENQRRQTKRRMKNSRAPSSKNHTQNKMVYSWLRSTMWKIVISFFASTSPSDGAGNSRQESRAINKMPPAVSSDSNGCFILMLIVS